MALDQGIALVRGFSLREDRDRFAVRRVRGGISCLSYGIIIRAGAYLSPAARSLIEAIRARHVPPRGGVARGGRVL